MSYFKKFTDFCSGFAAFMGAIYLFREFMKFEPTVPEELAVLGESVGIKQKLAEFFSKETAYDKYLWLVLVIMLVLSVVAANVFKRLPYLTPVFTLPPLLLTVDMIREEYISDYPMLHLVFVALAVMGSAYECVRMDRADKKSRAAWCADVAMLGFALYLWRLYDLAVGYEKTAYPLLDENGVQLEMSRFDSEILSAEPSNLKILLVLAIIYAALVGISLLLRDIYFIDAILALPPAVFLIYAWGAGKLAFHEELTVTFALACFALRLVPALGGNARERVGRGGVRLTLFLLRFAT